MHAQQLPQCHIGCICLIISRQQGLELTTACLPCDNTLRGTSSTALLTAPACMVSRSTSSVTKLHLLGTWTVMKPPNLVDVCILGHADAAMMSGMLSRLMPTAD